MKRSLDVAMAGLGLVVLSPLLLLLAAAIRVTSSGPAVYRSERIGRDGRAFMLLKFRTMVATADGSGPTSTASDDPRITKVGRRLRQWKLDELPQLVNVLRGDMSIVGPRPQVRWAVDRYGAEARRLLSVRPGITDYASIRFRDEAAILQGHDDPDQAYLELIEPEKIRLGLQYIDEQSLGTDLRIIRDTIAATFLGEDAAHD